MKTKSSSNSYLQKSSNLRRYLQRLQVTLWVVALMSNAKCQDPDRFPGFAIYENSDTLVDIEVDPSGVPVSIKKSNSCYSSVYDVASQTLYLEDISGRYTAKFMQSN